MENQNKSMINRVFKRIRAFFCTYDVSQIRQENEENSAPAPIDPSSTEPPMISPMMTKQIDETTSVVYRETLVKPSLLIPRQYFHDLLTNPNHPSVLIRRDPDFQRHFYRSRCSYPSHRTTIYPPAPFSDEELALTELRRLSMLTWSRSVRRLNNEYRSTLNALEQIREQLEQNESKEKSTINRPQLTRSPVENVSFPPISTDLIKTTIVQPTDLTVYPDLSSDEKEIVSPSEGQTTDSTVSSEEETTYTVDIIYRKIDPISKKDILIIRKESMDEESNIPLDQRTDSPPLMDKNRVRSIIKQMNSLTSTTSRERSFQSEDELLQWCQHELNNYSISINDFSSTTVWNDGLALCALIDRLFPDRFDWKRLSADQAEENFRLALKTAEEQANIRPILDRTNLSQTLIPYLRLLFNKTQTV